MNLLTSSAADRLRLPAQDTLLGNQEIKLSSVSSGVNPAFDLIGLTELRNDPQFAGIDGSGFSIAIIDTGIDSTHSLLADNYIAGYDFVDDNDSNFQDNNGHGTHVSGTVGATDPNIGVATDVGLIGLKALNDQGTGSLADIEDSLEWVLANQKKYNITAVNLSFGIGHFTPESGYSGDILSDDIERLEEAGVTVVAATGNNYFATSGQANQANIAFPAVDSTIAVGAVWQDGSRSNFQLETGSKDLTTGADRIASFSQRLDADNVVFAPGAVITSTVPGGGLGGRAGTSQAAPHVAGIVALMQEASMQFNQRLLTPDEVIDILSTTGDTITDGDDEDDNVVNTNTTYSRINAYNALLKVKSIGVTIVVPDLNGTIAEAQTVGTLNGTNTKSFTGIIGKDQANTLNNDVDIYSFDLITTSIVEIDLSSNSRDQADFNSYLRLFDDLGNEIAFNDDTSQSNTFSSLDANLEPGKYHVGVSGSQNSNYNPNIAGSGIAAVTGNYRLEFSLNNALESVNNTNNNIEQNINPVSEITPEPVNNTNNNIEQNINPVNEITPEPVNNTNNNIEQNINPVSEITPEPVNNTNNNIEQNINPVSEITPEPVNNINNNIEQNINPVSEEIPTLISDDSLASGLTVYRFFRDDLGVHFYTTDETEKDVIEDTLPQFNYEGASFLAADLSTDPLTGTQPVHRFLNTSTGTHLYTIDETEREFVDDNLDNYDYEGVAYHVYESEIPGTTPLYRFYNTDTNAHFYTPDLVEKDFVSSNLPSYQLEGNNGIAFYVEPI